MYNCLYRLLAEYNFSFNVHVCTCILYRILKQTLKASGSNATKSHIERTLYLLNACKLADSMFGVSRCTQLQMLPMTLAKWQSNYVSVKCMVTTETVDRSIQNVVDFQEPLSKGMAKISQGWLRDFIRRTDTDDSNDSDRDDFDIYRDELDINYDNV